MSSGGTWRAKAPRTSSGCSAGCIPRASPDGPDPHGDGRLLGPRDRLLGTSSERPRGRPVSALLGGRVDDRIRAYTYLYPLSSHDPGAFWVSAEMAAEAATEAVERGYTAVKFDPAGPYTIRGGHMPAMRDISRSAEFCAAIRSAVGDRADLLFGHPRAVHRGRRDPARRGHSHPMPPCGSRSRWRRTTGRDWPASRRPRNCPWRWARG